MKKFIGVKLVDAKPMTLGEYNIYRGWDIPADEDPETEGSMVVYKDGYVSWCPKAKFDKQNLAIVGEDNKINIKDVEAMIGKVFTTTTDIPGVQTKTTIVTCVLVNGFVITESSACVDPKNYSEEIGAECCMEKIKDKIWFLLGFLLQSGIYGFKGGE